MILVIAPAIRFWLFFVSLPMTKVVFYEKHCSNKSAQMFGPWLLTLRREALLQGVPALLSLELLLAFCHLLAVGSWAKNNWRANSGAYLGLKRVTLAVDQFSHWCKGALILISKNTKDGLFTNRLARDEMTDSSSFKGAHFWLPVNIVSYCLAWVN